MDEDRMLTDPDHENRVQENTVTVSSLVEFGPRFTVIVEMKGRAADSQGEHELEMASPLVISTEGLLQPIQMVVG